MAVLLDEPGAKACAAVLAEAGELVISAGTLAEALIVAEARGAGPVMERLVAGLGIEVIPVTGAMARLVSRAYAQWGKGLHPAGLNFGDCFAYALAVDRGCPLLFVGSDFVRTDVRPALG